MKVGDLKRTLQGIADDVEVVTPGEDHSYSIVDGVSLTSAEVIRESGCRHLSEYYDKANMSDQTNQIVPVVVID